MALTVALEEGRKKVDEITNVIGLNVQEDEAMQDDQISI